jgi:hypothetical protein
MPTTTGVLSERHHKIRGSTSGGGDILQRPAAFAEELRPILRELA